jgi:hypothetical protein
MLDGHLLSGCQTTRFGITFPGDDVNACHSVGAGKEASRVFMDRSSLLQFKLLAI